MIDEITYCTRWMAPIKSTFTPLSEEEARRLSEKDELHTALVKKDGRLDAAIELAARTARVYFFDESLRVVLTYVFAGGGSGRIFLEQAAVSEFAVGTDKLSKGSHYIFERDGRVTINDSDFQKDEHSTTKSTTDVSGNWEEYPKFGQYESIARRERRLTRDADHLEE